MRRRWILIGEDDKNDSDLAVTALDSLIPREVVLVARDGSEVLESLNRERNVHGDPAFILLDLKMPKMDGLEVLRNLKSNPDLRRIPVVMLTSSRQDNDVRRAYDLGVNAYVVKPVRFKDFRESLLRVGTFWLKTNELPP